MSLVRAAALVLVVELSACKVAETPESYIDPAVTVQEDRDLAASEIRDRVLAMAQAMGKGSVEDAMAALAPARDAYVLGPQLEGGGAPQVRAALDSLLSGSGGLRTQEVVVSVAPRANVAWFRTLLESATDTTAPAVRMSGVYLLDQGSWQLVQAHLSPVILPIQPDSSPPVPDEDPEEDG